MSTSHLRSVRANRSVRSVFALAPLAALALVAALGPGCHRAQPRRAFEFPAAAGIARPDTSRWPRAAAIKLVREDELLFDLALYGDSTIRFQRHEQIAVVGEAGLGRAVLRVPFGPGDELVLLRARVIAPGGQVIELPPDGIREEQGGAGERARVRRRLFSVPSLQVGSVLEYVYAIESRGMSMAFERSIADELPVQQYRLVLELGSTVEPAIKMYNLPAERQFERDVKDDRNRVRFSIENLDGDPGEEDQAPPRLREPRWRYRVVDINRGTGQGRQLIADNWKHATHGIAKSLYYWRSNGDRLEGVKLTIPTEECPDKAPACLAGKALVLVREATVFSGWNDELLAMRPLREALRTQTANASEKAVLLWHLLGRAGLEARLAATQRWTGDRIDLDFPTVEQLDHLLVYVPAQKGLGAPLWLDPSCEHCEAGQIPAWLAGADALVLSGEKTMDARGGQHFDNEARQAAVRGEPALGTMERTNYEARLGESGDLEVTVTEERRGSAAVEAHLETRDPAADQNRQDRAREQAEAFVRARSGAARLVEHTPLACDRAAGRCKRTLKLVVPGYATRDGDRLLVPLALLRSAWDDRYQEARRTENLYYREDAATAELARIALPPGWTLDALPAPERTSARAVDHAFEVKLLGEGTAAATLQVSRYLQRRRGIYGKEEYTPAREVVRGFAAVRDKVLVLRKAAAATVTAPAPAPAR